MTEIRKRNDAFDVFRGIGIVLMVMGHIGFGKAFDHYIHGFHMPMFFFAAGYFYNGRKYGGVKNYALQSAKALLIPYVVFVLLYQPLHFIYTGEYSAAYFLKSLLSSNHNRIDVAGAMWFLLCLFSARVLFCFVEQCFAGKKLLIVIILLTLFGNARLVKLPLCLDSAMSCMMIMYLGYMVKKNSNEEIVRKLGRAPVWMVGVIALINACCIQNTGSVNVRVNYFPNPVVNWINAIAAIFCCLYFANWLCRSKGKVCTTACGVLKYVSRNSIVYLVLNELMIFAVSEGMALLGVKWDMYTGANLYGIWRSIELILIMIGLAVTTEVIMRTRLKYLIGKF